MTELEIKKKGCEMCGEDEADLCFIKDCEHVFCRYCILIEHNRQVEEGTRVSLMRSFTLSSVSTNKNTGSTVPSVQDSI